MPSRATSEDEQRIALTGDFSLLQKRRGHRYSVDDMLVAHLAATFDADHQDRPPQHVLDLGCGLGSVLLITAWAFPQSEFVGLEVLDEHVAYARRNVTLNGCEDRVEIAAGDLRDSALIASLGRFDLVTASPPYFAANSGTHCRDPARAAAHFELRGGIEDYAAAASRALSPGGIFVACAGAQSSPRGAGKARPLDRGQAALEQAGLQVVYRQAVVPRVGKPPFLTLLVGRPLRSFEHLEQCLEAAPLVLRDANGDRSPQQIAIREWTGIPCPEARLGQ